MNTNPWRVMRLGLGDGDLVVGRLVAAGKHEFLKHGAQVLTFTDHAKAEHMASVLNRGRTPMDEAQFKRLTDHVPMKSPMRAALHDIMVTGSTWLQAAARHNVTEGGIARAMQRIKSLNLETS